MPRPITLADALAALAPQIERELTSGSTYCDVCFRIDLTYYAPEPGIAITDFHLASGAGIDTGTIDPLI